MSRPPSNPTAHLRILATATSSTPTASLLCEHCGQTKVLNLPLPIAGMLKIVKAFETLHTDCKKTTP